MPITILYPFFAVILGASITIFIRPKYFDLKIILAFSGSFLLSLLFLDILPKIFSTSTQQPGIWIIGGIVLQLFLELFSKGAEHGHVHFEKKKLLPFSLIFSLSLHAFLEGMPLLYNQSILVGIIVHKIPIGMVIGLLLWKTELNLSQKIAALLFFALMTPLGTLFNLQLPIIENSLLIIDSLVIGILLHISTVILFESSEGHVFNLRKFASVLVGIIIAYFTVS